MKSAKTTVVVLLSLLFVVWTAGALYGQSLADLARQQRARSGKEPPKSGKVFTNEDVSSATPSSPTSATAPATESQAGQQAAAAGETKPAAEPQKTEAELEKEYRDKFAKLREDQDFAERKVDVMQRELNLMQQQYYSDPNVALREQNTREEINKRTADIDAQKAAVEKAKQAIADLEEELRRKNLPAGWAR